MMKWSVSLLVILMPVLAAPAQAGWPFSKKVRPDPAQRVPELISILQTDPDERKRAEAAVELRDYDVRANPQVVPVLIDVLENEKTSWRVRLEAATTLGKQRPLSPEAGQALERAGGGDEALRVRLQAKSALFWSGYRASRQPEPPPVTNVEEPALPSSAPSSAMVAGPGPLRSILARLAGSAGMVPPPKGLRPGPMGPAVNQPPKQWPPPKALTGEPPLAAWPYGDANDVRPLPLPAPPRPTAPPPTWQGTVVGQPRPHAPVPLRTMPGPSLMAPAPGGLPLQPPGPIMEEGGPILVPPR